MRAKKSSRPITSQSPEPLHRVDFLSWSASASAFACASAAACAACLASVCLFVRMCVLCLLPLFVCCSVIVERSLVSALMRRAFVSGSFHKSIPTFLCCLLFVVVVARPNKLKRRRRRRRSCTPMPFGSCRLVCSCLCNCFSVHCFALLCLFRLFVFTCLTKGRFVRCLCL